jgi:TldD protein
MLIGNGPDAMKRISMVGNDMKLDTGIGNCGKAGQWVPVGVGQPHLQDGSGDGRRDAGVGLDAGVG